MAYTLPANRVSLLLLAGLLLVAGGTQWAALQQTPYANGWDGYYYVMQAHSWLTYGHLHSPDYSLIYPLVTAISALAGDFALGYKITDALLAIGLVGMAFGLVKSKTDSLILAALAGALVIASPTLTYFVVQFPKNTLGLIFLLGFLQQIHRANWPGAVLFLILAFFTHRMAAGLGLLLMGGVLLKQLHPRWILALAVLVIAASFLPGLLSWQDFARFQGEFQATPQLAPTSFRNIFGPSLSSWWQAELYLLSASMLLGMLLWGFLAYRRALHPFWGWAAPLLFILAVFPWFHFYQGSMGYRFFLTLPLWLYIFGVSLLPERKFLEVPTIGLMIISGFSYSSYRPIDHDPPNAVFEALIDQLQELYSPEQYPLVIAHKSLAELIVYQTDFNALNWAPPASASPDSVLRIVHGLEPYHLERALSLAQQRNVVSLGHRYYLGTESFWEEFRAKAERAGDEALLRRMRGARNPWQARPDYLTKGKE